MTSVVAERVLEVVHWTDSQFTLSTTRRASLRFENGQFVMLGLQVEDRPLLRAYSIASANHEDHLRFLSIKVPDGPLTSRLQNVRAGDFVLVSQKATGTLLLSDLKPGKRLYLLSTGTGVAPFLSLIQDLEVYERFEQIVLVHGVRRAAETAIVESALDALRSDEIFADIVRERLLYYPAITREAHGNRGRLTALMDSGKLFDDLGLPPLSPDDDRVMICGNPQMLKNTRLMLDSRGFRISAHIGEVGDYVIERAFVEK